MAALNEWFLNHPFITFFIIFVFVAFVYNKVFRVQQKLSIGKTILVYVIIAIGSVMLLFFQVLGRLPIILCLGVAILLMLIVRVRHFIEDRSHKKEGKA
ncbi:YlaH-like family protein [Paenibacillus albiflavus]|uniref:YlaH-like family protein n=1 Tax=Paenibacillus albiflavus TaxID=2545760 RepID=UPI0026C35DA7